MKHVIALALTWDGARWPVRSLSPKARAFLIGKGSKISASTAQGLTKLFANNQVREIRICWIPRLQGGSDVLAESFPTPKGRRISFQVARTVLLGDVCGVIYRKPLSAVR